MSFPNITRRASSLTNVATEFYRALLIVPLLGSDKSLARNIEAFSFLQNAVVEIRRISMFLRLGCLHVARGCRRTVQLYDAVLVLGIPDERAES